MGDVRTDSRLSDTSRSSLLEASELMDDMLVSESEDDSFKFPDSTIIKDSESGQGDQTREMLERMEAEKAFSRLYRTSNDGSLVQVVRRREFLPVTAAEVQQIKLRESKIAGSPLMRGNIQTTKSVEGHERFRYPYWGAETNRSSQNAQISSLRTRTSLPVQTVTTPPKVLTTRIVLDPVPPSSRVIFPQIKVRKTIPTIDNLVETRRDLGFDDLGDDFLERFQTFSSAQSTVHRMNTGTRNGLGGQRPKKKTLTKWKSTELEPQGKAFNPDEFRRERVLAEQAKALFLSGAFSKHYAKEREMAQKETMGWLKYL